MREHLQRLLRDRKLMGVFCRRSNVGSFLAGYLIGLYDEYALFLCFDPYGQFDGYCFKRIENIFRAETDSQYLRAMEKLIEKREIADPFGGAEVTLKDVFSRLAKEKVLCSVELFDDADTMTYGFITEVSDDGIVMREIDRDGKNDGAVCFLPQDVTTVCFDSRDEKKRRSLMSE